MKTLPLGDFLWVLRVKNTVQIISEENNDDINEVDEIDKKAK